MATSTFARAEAYMRATWRCHLHSMFPLVDGLLGSLSTAPVPVSSRAHPAGSRRSRSCKSLRGRRRRIGSCDCWLFRFWRGELLPPRHLTTIESSTLTGQITAASDGDDVSLELEGSKNSIPGTRGPVKLAVCGTDRNARPRERAGRGSLDLDPLRAAQRLARRTAGSRMRQARLIRQRTRTRG
jgi:hypothetical protein